MLQHAGEASLCQECWIFIQERGMHRPMMMNSTHSHGYLLLQTTTVSDRVRPCQTVSDNIIHSALRQFYVMLPTCVVRVLGRRYHMFSQTLQLVHNIPADHYSMIPPFPAESYRDVGGHTNFPNKSYWFSCIDSGEMSILQSQDRLKEDGTSCNCEACKWR